MLQGELGYPAPQPRLLGLPYHDWAAVPQGPQKVPNTLRGSSSCPSCGFCKGTLAAMATAGTELAPVAASKVMVTMCGWALVGRTEPGGTHGEHGERCVWHRDGAQAGQVSPPRVLCGVRWSWCSLPVD